MDLLSKNKIIQWHDDSVVDPRFEQVVGRNNFQQPWFLKKGAEISKAVGLIPNQGTAFLVSSSIIMTNWHVFRRSYWAEGKKISFDVELGENGLPLMPSSVELAPDKLFYANEDLDFAIVALSSPVLNRDIINIRNFAPVVKDTRVNIIQHPGAGLKKIAIRENGIKYNDGNVIQYWTDTEHGSSGAPLFNDKWEIIGLHYMNDSAESNDGSKVYYNVGHTMMSIVENIDVTHPGVL
ncbi:trypsin-like serine peptidase [Vibrio parahaemolyticus]|uniref:trypsin-like serine peptidase n=1 Tax=Vibrio parahaemolyticus TaxID=670 RepID=UPI001121B920|nr:serine protease [Vibrio parahaemolyticus]TON25635.1 hypothetical protein CGH60_16640 [Vibrio parahaemolyticus]TON28480.1 hypothetical protein CGH60_10280 [Vibrio parahaemolyticus]